MKCAEKTRGQRTVCRVELVVKRAEKDPWSKLKMQCVEKSWRSTLKCARKYQRSKYYVQYREGLDVIEHGVQKMTEGQSAVCIEELRSNCRKGSELLIEEQEVKVYSKGPTVKVQC